MNKNLLKVIYELRGSYDLQLLGEESLPEPHKFLLELEWEELNYYCPGYEIIFCDSHDKHGN